MSELVERVAEAIRDAHEAAGYESPFWSTGLGPWLSHARAAIAEMCVTCDDDDEHERKVRDLERREAEDALSEVRDRLR